MDKLTAGVITILILAILQIIAFVSGHNGIITGGVMGIIGLTAGAIFGFTYAIKRKGE